ncbi:hypothetical protein [Thiolinea disciformis]|uniref:hypothetical protein n=1 Tax=Thiolinea disciformis TaxID=125614 RepID=UPI000373DE92|nr:hypothetical protein [Thiolinea disciformis]
MDDQAMKTSFDRPAFLASQKSLYDLLKDYQNAQTWLMIAAVAAFLASAFFVVKYFAGGNLEPETWTSEQWLNASVGLGITAVITAAQAFLYQSGYKGPAVVVATAIVVFFGIFSEISQSMEREDATVRHRSENSAVFQAAVNSISQVAGAASNLSSEQKAYADAQAQLAYWKNLQEQKHANHHAVKYSQRTIDRQIADYQRLVEVYAHQVSQQGQNRSIILNSAIAQAKSLEYDEDKHYAMIRLIKEFLGITGIWASFLFSLIIIGTFEYAFHFVGAYVADHKAALRLLGRDTQGQLIHPEWLKTPESLSMEQQFQQPLSAETVPDRAEPLNNENAASNLAPTQPNMSFQQAPAAPSLNTTVLPTHYSDKVHDLTQKRFFQIIYSDIRHQIMRGKLKPTVRPVTDAVTLIIREKGAALGIQASTIGKPEKQKMAESILEQLASETVIQLNADGGMGKPKYVLAERFLNS